jgi:uncharacterized membrane protein YfcA
MLSEIVTLLITGFGAGVINSVAGGGALLIFPVLLSMGVPAIQANTTLSVGVYGGQISSAYGYKKYLASLDRRLFIFLGISALGGAIGAFILGQTTNAVFQDVAPWFVLLAILLLAFQPILIRVFQQMNKRAGTPQTAMYILLCAITLLISVYGGFFGAGMGIMIFAVLGFVGLKNVHQINGVKNLVTMAINTTANVYFVAAGLVVWDKAIYLLIGSALGGYIGSKTASRLPASMIRGIVIISGIVAFIVLLQK